MSYDLRIKVSEVCSLLNVDGLRGDIVTNRASQAIAAFEERLEVYSRRHLSSLYRFVCDIVYEKTL